MLTLKGERPLTPVCPHALIREGSLVTVIDPTRPTFDGIYEVAAIFGASYWLMSARGPIRLHFSLPFSREQIELIREDAEH